MGAPAGGGRRFRWGVRAGAVIAVALSAVLFAFWLGSAGRAKPVFVPFTRTSSVSVVRESVIGSPVAVEPDSLRIELIQVEPAREPRGHDRLQIDAGGQSREINLVVGRGLELDGESFRIAWVRTWQGLLPVADGAPMAGVTVLRGGVLVLEDLALGAGQRVAIDGEIALELIPCAGRAEALARIDAGPASGGARWGVADGAGAVWFESFIPGTGTTLSDGSRVTLESFDPAIPRLVVRKSTPQGEEVIRLDAPSSAPPLFLETPAGDMDTIRLFVFEDGNAIGVQSGPTANSAPVELAGGESWPIDGTGITLRLEQVLMSAAAVSAAESPFFEAVIESATRRVRVRQGEAVRVGDTLLRYLRRPRNETAAFRLRVSDPGKPPREVLIEPGGSETIEWAGGRWPLAHADVRPGEGVSLAPAARGWGTLASGVAALLIAIGLWFLPRAAAD